MHRQARGHMAFGHGVHHCVGQHVARIVMRVGFEAAPPRFPALQLAIPAAEVRLRTDTKSSASTNSPVTWSEPTG